MPLIKIGRQDWRPYTMRLHVGKGPDTGCGVMFDQSGGTTTNITEAQAEELIVALEAAFPNLDQRHSPEVTAAQQELYGSARLVANLLRNWQPLKRDIINRFLNAVEGAS